MRRRAALNLFSRFTLTVAGLAALSGAARADALSRTPEQTAGPYYPPHWPDDAGPDLIGATRAGARAAGTPLALSGRVRNRKGAALSGARVEIWQADNAGRYRHPHAPGRDKVDPAFRGFGAQRTDSEGRYRFFTLRPVPYTGRPPHIHVRIAAAGEETLTTQLYLHGHPDNDSDFLLRILGGGPRERLMMRPVGARLAEGLSGEQAAFDFVL